jgi:hypothetical protein
MLQHPPADPQRVAVALNVVIDWPAVAYVGMDDGEFVGSGGLGVGRGPVLAVVHRHWIPSLNMQGRSW